MDLIQHDRNGPPLWEALFDAIGRYWEPVIAGGAVRDYVLQIPAKDIDVFVPCSCLDDFTSIIDNLPPNLQHGRIIEASADKSCAQEYLTDTTDCVGVWEGEILGVPVNIVGRKSLRHGPEALVETFDFHVNRLYYDREVRIPSTTTLSDLAYNTWSLAHDRTYKQSLERFERYTERHGRRFNLVDPFNIAFKDMQDEHQDST